MSLLIWQALVTICFSGLLYYGSAVEETVSAEKPKIEGEEGLNSCPLKNSKYPVFLPHPNDCGKFFICDSGTPHLQTCQAGLHFNPKVKACDFPQQAGCDKDLGVSEKPRGRMIDEDDEFGVCPNKNSKYPTLIRHPTECSKFFICDSGTPHPQTCQAGLHFNTKIHACDFPDQAGCEEDSGITEDPGYPVDEDDSDGCPAKNSDHPVYIPHPTDCNKFYICDSGSPHLQTCQAGLHFNRKIKACDFPERALCDKDIQITVKPEGRMIDDDLGICPDGNSKFPVLIPHPTSCSMFFICDNGTPHPKECQPGLHYNPKIKACDYPENSGCDRRNPSVLMSAGVPSPYCPPVDGKIPIFFRSFSDCSVYYMCSHGLAYEFTCPARLHFNERMKQCDYEENAKCQNINS